MAKIEEKPESPIQTDQNPVLFVPQVNIHLTGGKVQTILDNTLQKCYTPLIHFHWFKEQLASLFELFEQNPRTKLSKKTRKEFISDLFNLINTEDEESFVFKFKECGVGRNFISKIITDFLSSLKPFLDMDYTYNSDLVINSDCCSKFNSEIYEIESKYNNVPLSKLLEIYKEIHYWYTIYLQFKQMVAAKFYRLAYKFSKKECSARPSLEIDCLFQNLLMVLDLAIDRYDSEKGALASHIQTWMKGYILNESCSFELGQAFQVYSWNLKTLERENRSSYCISTDSEEYREGKRNEDSDGYISDAENEDETGDFEFSLNNLDVNLLKVINNIQLPEIDVVKLVLGIPKFKNF